MNSPAKPSFRSTASAAQRLARCTVPVSAPVDVADAPALPEIRQLLGRLLGEESTLYAITREWRYDAAGRMFVRLHALLDEQFTEIGRRLVRLAARSRDLGCWTSTGHGDRAMPARVTASAGELEAHILNELLALHQALLKNLHRGRATSQDAQDVTTRDILADLIADHEKDAFMLRALLWEVQNNAA